MRHLRKKVPADSAILPKEAFFARGNSREKLTVAAQIGAFAPFESENLKDLRAFRARIRGPAGSARIPFDAEVAETQMAAEWKDETLA